MNIKWNIVRFRKATSTQDIAREYVLKGYNFGTVFVAETQTMGHGSWGRRWFSPIGGLYMTVILKPVDNLSLIPLMAGMAAADAIKDATKINANVKWPNDIYIGDKKVGGVIVESGWLREELKFLFLGVGINVNNQIPVELPDATSIIINIAEKTEIDLLLRRLLSKLERYLSFLEVNPLEIIEAWKKISTSLGKRLKVIDRSGEIITGFASDIDADGALLVKVRNGQKRVFSSSQIFNGLLASGRFDDINR